MAQALKKLGNPNAGLAVSGRRALALSKWREQSLRCGRAEGRS